ncbi:hypothetical protein HG531_002468 [Fusarium graminearum]|nr:hypothetical protein HG531_002468 [Fusarium graminearum]
MSCDVQSPAGGHQNTRWKYLDQIRQNAGPYTDPEAIAPEALEGFNTLKVLVIGAGGLGCEILKNLAMSGFKNIHVIDMDTIDISNLNRQFLFRKDDVGKYKAEVAAAFVEKRVKGVSITAHNNRIQDFDEEFYKQFQLVICGLDSIEARRWINAMLVSIAEEGEDADALKPLIDGGTEGFKGQARVILPTMTSCIECQLDMHAPRAAVPLCTIASIPRQPEHCVEWAHVIAWDKEKPFPKLDKDDPEHVTWLFQKALTRAQEFGIPGVTYSLTQGTIKNIIPAIASTNAIIAAACCNEAFKIATSSAPCLGFQTNYMMYSGNDSIYTYTFKHEKKDDCPVCGRQARPLEVDPKTTLQELIESFAIRPEAQLKKASVRAEGKTLYMQFPPSLEEQTRPNLNKTLNELGLEDGQQVVEELIAVPLPRALDGEDKVVSSSAKLHLALELFMTESLTADSILHGVDDHRLGLALVSLITTAGLCGILGCNLLKPNNTLGETLGKLLGVGSQDGLGDRNGWVRGRNSVLAAKVFGLSASGHKDNVSRINVGIVVRLERVVLGRRSVLVDGTCHIKLEADRVPVEATCIRIVTSLWLLVPLEEVVQTLATTLEGNKAKSVGENLVLNNGGVVLDVDVLDGEGRNLGEEDTAESVCERGVDPDK